MNTQPTTEQANRKILVLLDHLFFAAKINQAALATGARVSYTRTAIKALEVARNERLALIIIDLDAAAGSPLDLIAGLKSDEALRAIPILGFVSHINAEAQDRARALGCDRVLARSVFDRNLADLLSGYC